VSLLLKGKRRTFSAAGRFEREATSTGKEGGGRRETMRKKRSVFSLPREGTLARVREGEKGKN